MKKQFEKQIRKLNPKQISTWKKHSTFSTQCIYLLQETKLFHKSEELNFMFAIHLAVEKNAQKQIGNNFIRMTFIQQFYDRFDISIVNETWI